MLCETYTYDHLSKYGIAIKNYGSQFWLFIEGRANIKKLKNSNQVSGLIALILDSGTMTTIGGDIVTGDLWNSRL